MKLRRSKPTVPWWERNRTKELTEAAEEALRRLRRVFKELGAPPKRKAGEDKF
jgi:hypothetical protein